MSEIENPYSDAAQISSEVTRALIGLGIDWNSESSLRAIAREALDYKHDAAPALAPNDIQGHTRQKLFGLIALMLRTMQEGADLGAVIHGNDAWKALAKALWAEAAARKS